MQPLQTTALADNVSSSLSMFDLFLQSDSIVKFVMLILLVACIVKPPVLARVGLMRRLRGVVSTKCLIYEELELRTKETQRRQPVCRA